MNEDTLFEILDRNDPDQFIRSCRETGERWKYAKYSLTQKTLLHVAIELGRDSTLALWLIYNGIDLSTQDKNGYTALHIAVLHRNYAVAEGILMLGGQVDAVDESGQTPLHKAVIQRDHDLIKLLLTCKADVNHEDTIGCKPLNWLFEDQAIARSLFSAGARLGNRRKDPEPAGLE